jgi:hypothetical protein
MDMRSLPGGGFDPETVALMKTALDEAWASLTEEQRARRTPNELASRVVRLAKQGERDPARLRTFAIAEVVSTPKQAGR